MKDRTYHECKICNNLIDDEFKTHPVISLFETIDNKGKKTGKYCISFETEDGFFAETVEYNSINDLLKVIVNGEAIWEKH
jgi:hypothetical protein